MDSAGSSLKSLLSLAGVASAAVPIQIQSGHHRNNNSDDSHSFSPPSSFGASSYNSTTTTASSSLASHGHRRLPSRSRRLSDARDAAIRSAPSPPSLAGLSLSTSPGTPTPEPTPPNERGPPVPIGATPIPIGKSKKRGTDFKCESCSKIYRHPSCLIKHRWEHTPHWRESSKYVLSKHQQVQLLEAAAILSHLGGGDAGRSLPEDRSLWPSFLSGGSLPGPGEVPQYQHKDPTRQGSGDGEKFVSTQTVNGFTISSGVSSSVPSRQSTATAGPRMHDYEIRPGKGGVGVIARSSSATPHPPPSVKKEEEEMGYGVIGRGRPSFKSKHSDEEDEDEEMDVREPTREEEWDGMEMEMDMD